MKIFLSVVAFTMLLLLVSRLLPLPSQSIGTGAVPDNALPWQIRVDARTGQSEVFGLKPGTSTLFEARQRFGGEPDIGIVAARDELGNLEAYYAQVSMGPLQGRLILTLDADQETLKAMRARAVKAEYMESATRKIRLSPEDVEAANRIPLRAISFIPGTNLDDAILRQRFGTPEEVIQHSETLSHYLYPKLGLDIVLDTKGKEILQYVAPGEFETRIRAPLMQQEKTAQNPRASAREGS
ncbi:MAG: hypothetical protein LBO79_11120 [Zoogloeaceae bacterium]|jgi:hypothetical protein|nr:hypothetical protein [Zoogloeaceae bacterium]